MASDVPAGRTGHGHADCRVTANRNRSRKPAMPDQSEQPPPERRHDDDSTRTKRDDRINDRRTHAKHPDDDRLTPADLHRRRREPWSKHAQVSRRG
jgi:hypothetical protein